jgi:hypothetical protein
MRGVVSMLTVVTESFLRWARESIVTLEEMAQGRRVGRIDFFLYRTVAIRRESMPQGLKPAVVNVQDAKAKTLAYLEAKTFLVQEQRHFSRL